MSLLNQAITDGQTHVKELYYTAIVIPKANDVRQQCSENERQACISGKLYLTKDVKKFKTECYVG